MTALSADALAGAYVDACLAELEALKPGNIHSHAPGDGRDLADFRASAEASAPGITLRGARIGRRIEEAVRATHSRVGWNTNLGIVLLCAPIAAAAEGTLALRPAIENALAGLDLADAEGAFAAIRLAAPGGLGRAAAHDVAQSPQITLREAMAAAAAHDRIANAYVTGFADLFEVGLPALRLARANDLPRPWQVASLFMAFLAARPDTHIVRKFGLAAAEAVQRRAGTLRAGDAIGPDAAPDLLAFDAELKGLGHNPGTSADFTVATIMLDNILAARATDS